MFQKIPVKLSKLYILKERCKKLLHAIGGEWYMNKSNEKIPTQKKRKLSKKSQEKENKIKINLKMADQNWNERKFQIHWNKLEWVNLRSRIEQKSILCVF